MNSFFCYFFVLLLLMPSDLFARSAPAHQNSFERELQDPPAVEKKEAKIEEQVVDFCRSYRGLKGDFTEKFMTYLDGSSAFRASLIKALQANEVPQCRKYLDDYMQGVLSSKVKPKGIYAVVSISLIAKIPTAIQFIENEIEAGRANDWLDALEEESKEAYENTLKRWVKKVELAIRKDVNTMKNDGSLYGTQDSASALLSSPEERGIWSPLLMTRFFTMVTQNSIALTPDEFSSVNAIYGATTASFRTIFLENFAKTIKIAPPHWIASFRKEPYWIQFRLLPVMEKVPCPEIIDELTWMAKHHQEFKMRQLAKQILDEMMVLRKKKK